jgi:hypothetical protein
MDEFFFFFSPHKKLHGPVYQCAFEFFFLNLAFNKLNTNQTDFIGPSASQDDGRKHK